MIKLKYIFLVLFFYASGIKAQELWSGVNAQGGIMKNTSILIGAQTRNSIYNLDYKKSLAQAGVQFDINDYVASAISFRRYFDKDKESRIIGDLLFSPSPDTNTIAFFIRLRYQHSEFTNEVPGENIVRGAFQLRYYLTKSVKPFIEVEPFYQTEKESFMKCRLDAGLSIKFNKNIRTRIVYRTEKNLVKSNKPLETILVLGLGLRLNKKKDSGIVPQL